MQRKARTRGTNGNEARGRGQWCRAADSTHHHAGDLHPGQPDLDKGRRRVERLERGQRVILFRERNESLCLGYKPLPFVTFTHEVHTSATS